VEQIIVVAANSYVTHGLDRLNSGIYETKSCQKKEILQQPLPEEAERSSSALPDQKVKKSEER